LVFGSEFQDVELALLKLKQAAGAIGWAKTGHAVVRQGRSHGHVDGDEVCEHDGILGDLEKRLENVVTPTLEPVIQLRPTAFEKNP